MKKDYLVTETFALQNNLFKGHISFDTFKYQSFIGCPGPISRKIRMQLWKDYENERKLQIMRELLISKR